MRDRRVFEEVMGFFWVSVGGKVVVEKVKYWRILV